MKTTIPVVLIAVALSWTTWAQQSIEQQAIKKNSLEVRRPAPSQLQVQNANELLQVSQSQGSTAPYNTILSVEGLPFKGERTAKITVVEFSDYQCPFCGLHVRETLPQIEKEYVQTGKLKYVFSALPLESIHPDSFRAAEGAYCAGDQAKYWEMHDQLFGNQSTLSMREQSLHAQFIGLNVPTFQQCLFSDKYAVKIRSGIATAHSLGVEATPAFLFGFTSTTTPEIRVLKVISGAQHFSVFKTVIESLLSLPPS